MCHYLQLIFVAGNTSRKATIEILPADVLIKIFDFYRLDPVIRSPLGGRPWKWQKLAYVCKTWRSVLLATSHYLGLRLFFTDGMPVREILSSSPILPIVMRYIEAQGSSPPTLGDQDNITALLELPTRLREVHLSVTTPLLEKVTALMQQPFSMLEYLRLSTLHGLVLPSIIGGGMTCLRALRMVGFALPAFPQLLLSAHDLDSLQLEEIPSVGYTLEALINCLPAMTQLKTLRIHFLSPASRPVLICTDRPLPSSSVLPVLNLIGFRGTSEYLESLLSGISAPRLEHLLVDFFDQRIFDTPQLSRFIRRAEMQRSHTRVTIHSSVSGISITLTQPGAPHRLFLRILCRQLIRQIPSMAEICDRIFPTLADVEQLEISASGASFRDGQGEMDLIHLGILEIFRPFRNVKRLCVTDGSLSLVAGALRLVSEELAMVALPELQEFQTKKNAEIALAQRSLAPFLAARRRSTHPVVVCSTPPLRVRFDEDPNMDTPLLSPASPDSCLSLSPGPSMTPPHTARSPSLLMTPPHAARSPSLSMTPPHAARSPGPLMTPPHAARSPSLSITPPHPARSPSLSITPPHPARSPGPSVTPPHAARSQSPSMTPPHTTPPISPLSLEPHPRVYISSPIAQPHALPYIPPAPLTPHVYLNSVLATPSLQYDIRFHPNKSSLHLSSATLAKPASNPPCQSLPICVAGLPWNHLVRPDPSLSHGNAVVTVQDVLVAIYSYLRKVVNADEYNAMGTDKKIEISRVFERRVRHDPAQRVKGLRRVDFLGSRVIAQGLVSAQLLNDAWVWDVVVR